MPQPPIPTAVHRRILALKAEGRTDKVVAGILKRSTSTVNKYSKLPIAGEEASGPLPDRAFSEDEDGRAVLSVQTEVPVKTLADAIRVAEVDENVWFVESWQCTQWTVPVKVGPRDDRQVTRTQQYRVKVQLKRIVSRPLKAALDAIYERMAKHCPKYPKSKDERASRAEPHMGVFGLFDAHFGKLCWKPETGSDYDLKIAEAVFRNAVEDLLGECAHRRLTRAVLPIGNDFFHIDNKRNTTYHGTPQDVDGRYAKVFEVGLLAVVWAVEQLAAVAPVEVVWVPGNHDPTISYHLAKTVGAWFRQNKRVTVDCGPKKRKYLSWGGVLLGLTHGDEIRSEDLPGLMAAESRAEWARATCTEWLLGHQHRERQWVTKSVDTHRGTTVRVLRALAGTDAWHYEKGYVGAQPACEVYFYGKERGYAGHAVVNARGG